MREGRKVFANVLRDFAIGVKPHKRKNRIFRDFKRCGFISVLIGAEGRIFRHG